MINKQQKKQFNAEQRRRRVRSKIKGTAKRPRLNIFRSAKHLYLQLIDDDNGQTIAAVKDSEIKAKDKPAKIARAAGKLIAQKAQKKNIDQVVFDRSKYKFHGRVKAVAEGAREAGLKF
jgi:large subunit ribosomal protein L18